MQCTQFVLRTAAEHRAADEATFNAFLHTVQVTRVEAAHVVASTSYWTLLVFYEPLPAESPAATSDAPGAEEAALTPAQEAVYAHLRDWRSAQSARDGVPVFVKGKGSPALPVN